VTPKPASRHEAMIHLVWSAGGLAFSFSLGVLLQLLGCLLWHNWWPMLTAFMYVLVPMPMLFFGGMDSGSYGGSTLASG
jgi:Vacuolar protein sorting 55